MPEPSDARGIDSPDVKEEDWYYDGPYLVFTETYHRKRGFCCQSGCRHCPYGFLENNPLASQDSEIEPT